MSIEDVIVQQTHNQLITSASQIFDIERKKELQDISCFHISPIIKLKLILLPAWQSDQELPTPQQRRLFCPCDGLFSPCPCQLSLGDLSRIMFRLQL